MRDSSPLLPVHITTLLPSLAFSALEAAWRVSGVASKRFIVGFKLQFAIHLHTRIRVARHRRQIVFSIIPANQTADWLAIRSRANPHPLGSHVMQSAGSASRISRFRRTRRAARSRQCKTRHSGRAFTIESVESSPSGSISPLCEPSLLPSRKGTSGF